MTSLAKQSFNKNRNSKRRKEKKKKTRITQLQSKHQKDLETLNTKAIKPSHSVALSLCLFALVQHFQNPRLRSSLSSPLNKPFSQVFIDRDNGGSRDVCVPSRDQPASESDHQHFLQQQGDLSSGTHQQLIWCKPAPPLIVYLYLCIDPPTISVLSMYMSLLINNMLLVYLFYVSAYMRCIFDKLRLDACMIDLSPW